MKGSLVKKESLGNSSDNLEENIINHESSTNQENTKILNSKIEIKQDFE